jgi:cellulose synthase/poly-beta-1,6-N-acetylglucosamine synthase-like glycosyltransferase
MDSVVIAVLILSLYYTGAMLFLFKGLVVVRRAGPGKPARLTFSVVIAAHNEEKNIGECLAAVFGQNMSPDRYEVIVVNDRSSDATGVIAGEWARRHPTLTILNIDATPPGIAPKKHAVMQGIARARNEVVVLTDADCRVPSGWLDAIDRTFTRETGLVQGITAYVPSSGMHPLFFGLQALDFLSHGIVAASAIGAGMPINSNANNFAFRKKAFDEVGGYGRALKKVVSGDDDLLLQRIAASRFWQVRFMADHTGAVTTAATPTIRGVFEQRKRWGSKTVHYTARQAGFLSGIFLFYCAIVAAFAIGLFHPFILAICCGLFAIKIAGEYLLLWPGTALFGQKQLRPFILPASFLQVPLVIAAVFFGVFGRFSWKGERFRREVG